MDVFWSFAFGAGFAAAAAHQLRLAGPNASIYENKYFAYTMCFLSMSKIFLYFATLRWPTSSNQFSRRPGSIYCGLFLVGRACSY